MGNTEKKKKKKEKGKKKKKKKEKASIKKYKKFNTHTHKQIKRMANKFVAVFLMCIVVVAAFSLQEAKAAELDKFKGCFSNCGKGCLGEGNGNTFCEKKCDNDCSEKELAEKLNINLP